MEGNIDVFDKVNDEKNSCVEVIQYDNSRYEELIELSKDKNEKDEEKLKK
ncbi:hypothetical protein [Halonatronum saccharophilum]|nr:hypothetical protein [Halonatronum saccharophilum]